MTLKRQLYTGYFAVLFLTLFLFTAIAGEESAKDTSSSSIQNSEKKMLFYASDLLKRGEIKEARQAAENLLSSDPESQDGRVMLATIMLEEGSYEEAKAIFEALIEESPDNHIMLNNFAWLLATAEDPSFRDPGRAVVMAQEAILLSPNSFHVWSTLAQAHYVNRNFEKAVTIMGSCIDIAKEEEAPEETIQKYRQELSKYRTADKVMRLIE